MKPYSLVVIYVTSLVATEITTQQGAPSFKLQIATPVGHYAAVMTILSLDMLPQPKAY